MKTQKQRDGIRADKRLNRMLALSAVLHGVVIAVIMLSANRSQSRPPVPVAYTVTLVDPATLGTASIQSAPVAAAPKPEVRAPQPASQPKPQPVVKGPPVEKKEVSPKEVSPKKEVPPEGAPPSQPKKEMVKLSEKAQPAAKPPVKPEPKTVPRQKPVDTTAQARTSTTQPTAPASPQPPQKKLALSSDERDKRILAALERIRAKVERGTQGGDGSQGSGPPTLGGPPGAGGGGEVRGLEFLMYTQEVKRRVKENWIVAEQRPDLTAVVRFGVQPTGEIFDVELTRPSGNRAFDQSVVRAVHSANPLPSPPQTYQSEFIMQKVEVTFGGEEHAN